MTGNIYGKLWVAKIYNACSAYIKAGIYFASVNKIQINGVHVK